MKGAYCPSWRSSSFSPSAIDPSLFTHIYYAFLSPNPTTFTFDINNSTASVLTAFNSAVHSKIPQLKTLFSVGGANDDVSELFANMASTRESRLNLILSSIQVARTYGFDGIDLDWEFPQTQKEMNDMGTLFQEWHDEIIKESRQTRRPQLLLSAAVYFSVTVSFPDTVRKYPIESINKNVDWINAMCYDYHGPWEPNITGAPSALFDPKGGNSTSKGLNSWIEAGILKNKLVMGLPLYGRTWTLANPNDTGVGAPATRAGLPGGGGDTVTLPFNEVEEFNKNNNATIKFDGDTRSTFSVAGTAWIGYDDTRSTEARIEFAQSLGIGGYFFWALSFDDQEWTISKTAAQLWR